MRNYDKGARLERYLVRKYRNERYFAWRTPASKSPVDIIIYDKLEKKWYLVQVKKVSKEKVYLSQFKKDIEELKQFKEKYFNDENVVVQLWIKTKNKWEKITL